MQALRGTSEGEVGGGEGRGGDEGVDGRGEWEDKVVCERGREGGAMRKTGRLESG